MQLLCVSWWIPKLLNRNKILLFAEVLLPFCSTGKLRSWELASSDLIFTSVTLSRRHLHFTYTQSYDFRIVVDLWFWATVNLFDIKFEFLKKSRVEGITNPENLTSERISLQPQMKLHLSWAAFDVCLLTERDNRTLKKFWVQSRKSSW